MLRYWVVVLLLSSPAVGQTLPLNDYPPDAPLSFDTIHDVIGANLNDPDSAQYSNIVFVDGPLAKYACGLVSWPNPVQGGYFEAMPFAAPLSSDLSRIEAEKIAYGQSLVLRSPCAGPLGL